MNNTLLPPISRARAYRLYDYRGNRIIDMYQNNGHALLGHRSDKLTTVMKNVISRGLIFDMPSIYSKRLEKLVSGLFQDFNSIRIYSSINYALEAASAYLGESIDIDRIYDPAVQQQTEITDIPSLTYWRPFLAPACEKQIFKARLLIPVLPFSIGGGPQILCFREKIEEAFMPSSVIAPFLLAGIIRSIADIKKYRKPEWNLEQYIDKSQWNINTIYISAKFNKNQYNRVFQHFLSHNVLLSPVYPGPSILPAELSLNEIKKIQHLFKKYPGDFACN